MTLTTADMAKLAKDMRGGKDVDKDLPETPLEFEEMITATVPTPGPKPPVDPFAKAPVAKDDLLAYVKTLFATEAASFTDAEITDFMSHYLDGPAYKTVRMTGLHMRDRLEKRANGKPHFDDLTGIAEAEG